MPTLTLSKGTFNRVQVEKRDDEGTLETRVAHTFATEGHFRQAARELGVPADWLKRTVDGFQQADGGPPLVCPVPGRDGGGGFSVVLRGRRQKASEGLSFEGEEPLAALRQALDSPAAGGLAEPVIHWKDAEALCCVDGDYHHVEFGHRTEDRVYSYCVEPRPAALWTTHGRGLRLVYGALGGFSAKELAAAAALWLKAQDPLVTLELKTSTRHPGVPVGGRAAGPVVWQTPSAEVPSLTHFLGSKEASDEQVEQWLGDRGFRVGCRYDHSLCPVAPDEAAGRDPVVVRDAGVFCHACSGRGIVKGSRSPGWFPFASLVGGALPSNLRCCLDHASHWEHARFVLEDCLGLTGAVAEAAYSAALVLRGHPRELVRRAFTAGRNFIRLDRRWATLSGESYKCDPGLRPIVERLPAAQYMGPDSRVAVDPERVARLLQPVDLGPYGYPALHPIWSVRIYSHHLPLGVNGQVPIVLQVRDYASPAMEPFRARYVPPRRREFTEDQAWGLLEGPLPGLNRDAVKLLVAAKGCAEGRIGLPPMIFFSGPTGAAKSATVLVAAAVCADRNASVVWTPSVERVRQSIAEAKESGSFVTFNEVVKEGDRQGSRSLATMGYLLNLTPDSVSHKLYVGPVPLGSLPVCVWTDTGVPMEVRQDAQLARRLVHVHLARQVDWPPTLREHGVAELRTLRWASPCFAPACDVILSHVIDEFFREPTTFDEVAKALGFGTLGDSQEAAEGRETLVALFREACRAPDASGQDAVRWSARGWKVIGREQMTPLADLWRQVADEDFLVSRKCAEVDWARLLGCEGPVSFETRAHGRSKMALRWVRAKSRLDYQVNGELMQREVPLIDWSLLEGVEV